MPVQKNEDVAHHLQEKIPAYRKDNPGTAVIENFSYICSCCRKTER